MHRSLAVTTVAVLASLGGTPARAGEWAQPDPTAERPTTRFESLVAVETMASPSASTDSMVAAPVLPGTPPASAPGRGLGQRTRRAVGSLLSDGWVVVSSPFRLRGRGLLWTGATLAAAGVIYAHDQEILDATIRNHDEPVFGTVLDIGHEIEPVGFMGRTNPIYAAALVAGYAFDVRALRVIPTEILESHILAGGVRNLGKVLVGRRRPFENQGPRAFEFGTGTSFPSGHASVAFELATIASMNARTLPVTIAAYSLATTVALQRVDSRNHWPSDVFVAAAYGTLVARTVVLRNEQRERDGKQGVSILPHFSDDGRCVGFRLSRSM